MKFNTDHLQRCVRTLESSLVLLDAAEPDSIDYEGFAHQTLALMPCFPADARSTEAVRRKKFGDGPA